MTKLKSAVGDKYLTILKGSRIVPSTAPLYPTPTPSYLPTPTPTRKYNFDSIREKVK